MTACVRDEQVISTWLSVLVALVYFVIVKAANNYKALWDRAHYKYRLL